MEEHVEMMRALRAESVKRPWYGRLFRDQNDREFALGSRLYDTEELRVRGITVRDFLLGGVSWDRLYALGYRIADMKRLGGTVDDILALGVRMEHLVDEFEHVNSDFVSKILVKPTDLLQWTPAELFKMGYTMDSLLAFGLNDSHIPLAEMQYFFAPTQVQRMQWSTKSRPVSLADASPVVGRAHDTRELSSIKIDVSRLT